MTDTTDMPLTRLNVSEKATHRSLTDIDTPLKGVSRQSVKPGWWDKSDITLKVRL